MSMTASWEALKARESNAKTYARHIDRLLVRGEGVTVQDHDGRSYIDCLACAGALPLGHNHPYVNARVEAFLRSGQLQQALDIATPAKLDFMRQLWRILPPAFAETARVQFCGPSGSDAVEAALKLCKTATGRRSVLAFHGAYHGQTLGALSLMGNLGPKQAVAGLMSEVHFAPYPNPYRCPFGVGGAEGERLALNYLATLLEDPESGITKPAAVVVEAVQGEGGCIPASAAWLRGVRELTRRHDIPLVVDEIQAGFGRTGTHFAFEIAGIEPDAIVLSKAAGGGFPLALIAYHQRHDVWRPGAHTGTFRGNQIGLVAGAATIEYLLDNDLTTHARHMGTRLMDGLLRLKREHPVIGDVRGRGLMVGAEIVNPGAAAGHRTPPADGQLARAIKSACLEQGLIIETGGRHGAVLRFLPPLVITAGQVDDLLGRLERALVDVAVCQGAD
ncbi:MAG TPA: diaminobutyrate--2-oxoglutarate transaminase family protein [Burkholderiaceae bacterium]|nr:diaminobutyrate--2-oxoglutarate transaminase family protein [Burkholderiaceae bacterium]